MKKMLLLSLGASCILSASVDSLKFSGELRTSYDNLQYKMANGDTKSNDSMLVNRMRLGFKYSPSENSYMTAQVSYNKQFGQTNVSNNGFDSFDWYINEKSSSNELRVRYAYFDYKKDELFGANIPWSIGIGRKNSTQGKLINLRDDDKNTAPLGHIINAEFDGVSLTLHTENILGLKGSLIKLATGRGMSNTNSAISPAPYSNNDLDQPINMAGLNIVPYDNGLLHTEFQATYASNLVDITSSGFDNNGNFNPANYNSTLHQVGDEYLFSFMTSYKIPSFQNLLLFGSVAMTQTKPKDGETMLGSQDSEIGTSVWVGIQKDCMLMDDSKIGFEFNQGSKYWRPFTYAEDTAIGSKIATRGNAYEMYLTKHIDKNLSLQVRYTYIDYKFSGSNGFFGSQTGTPIEISKLGNDIAGSVADNAQDFRAYLKYQF